MNQDVKIYIIELLKKRGAYSHSVNNKQHYTRCPYCGDSTNLSHAHLSIKIDIESDSPMLFRCLKCGVTGMLTNTTLEELGLYIDSDMRKELKSYNRKSMILGNLVNLEFERYQTPISDQTLSRYKLKYINDRLGLDLTPEDAKDCKIVLSIFDFMKSNQIQKINHLTYDMLKNLENNYVGFLSCNNNVIIFRDITNKQKYRYFKVLLNEKNVNQDTFYALPNSIGLLYTNEINVHIAEGTFDILSIQKNVVKSSENNYYYAMCGYGSISILKYLVHHGINTGINLHIYSDNDKTDDNQKKYLFNGSFITEWVDHIYIHRNDYANEKDYGVPLENIIDTKTKVR